MLECINTGKFFHMLKVILKYRTDFNNGTILYENDFYWAVKRGQAIDQGQHRKRYTY